MSESNSMLDQSTYVILSGGGDSTPNLSQNIMSTPQGVNHDTVYFTEGIAPSLGTRSRERSKKPPMPSANKPRLSSSLPRATFPQRSLHSELQNTFDEEVDNQAKRKRAECECMICSSVVTGINDSIKCQVCHEFSCLQCTKLDPSIIPIIGDNFMCNSCKKCGIPSLKTITSTLTNIQQKSDERWSGLDVQWSDLQQRMTSLEATIDTKLDLRIDALEKDINTKIEKKIDDDIIKMREDVGVTVSRTIDTVFSERAATEEEKFRKYKRELDENMNEKIKSIQIAMEDEMKIKMEEEIRKQIKEQADSFTGPDRGNQLSPGSQVSITVREVNDRERRKRNLVIHGVKEPNSSSSVDKDKLDCDFVQKVLTDGLKINCPEGVVKSTRRLGKKTPEKGKGRPILVTLDSADKKQAIYKNLNKLRDSKYKDLSINDDMTQLERQQLKRLVEKAKDLEKKDQSCLFRVRGPPWDRKIVKLPKKPPGQGDGAPPRVVVPLTDHTAK